MKTPLYPAAAAALGTCLLYLPLTFLQAAESGPETAPASDRQEALEIVITAGRKPQSTRETLAPVTVITREAIETSQATDVVAILRQVPGLSLKNSGGLGKQTSLHLRGTNDKHVLVLVDGIKVGSATLGTTRAPWFWCHSISYS